MKLTTLNPRWIGLHNWSDDSIYHIGVSFDSPKQNGKRLAVLFSPPIDPDGLAQKWQWGEPFKDAKKWKRTGETFETLTLAPSLDFSPIDWHGHITNGEVA